MGRLENTPRRGSQGHDAKQVDQGLSPVSRSRCAHQRGGVVQGIILFFLTLLFLAAAAAGIGGYLAYKEVHRPGPLAAETVVLLEPGMGVNQIGAILAENDIIRHAELFNAAVRWRQAGATLKAGEYRFAPGVTVLEVIDILVDGSSILHFLTFAEGRTTKQIVAAIEADGVLTGEITMEPREGALLPETYGFSRGETRDALIKRMASAQKAVLDELWESRASDLPLANRREAVILASIVEKETGIASERDRVAAVFINRLRKRMRLESDPTIIYGLTGGEPLGRGLRQSELRGETPYNTYVIRGLPPTPICNPGRASIEAVLNPAQTDDLFFVADGTGGHAFARTLRDHNANVRRWRQIERQNRR
ncbi:MAG: endolytic transglycosylase MltG [Pseudomonadota bacterium]